MDNEIKKSKHTTQAAAHDSNPFTTVIAGIEKLFTYNTSSLTAYIFFSVAAGIIIVMTVIALFMASITFIQQNSSLSWLDNTSTIMPQLQFGAFGQMTQLSVLATWIIGLPLLIILGLLVRLCAIKIALASSDKKTIGLGEALKQSFKRIVPALGLVGIILGVVVAACVVLGLLTHILGPIGFVLIVIAIIGFLYIAVRCAFAWLALVNGAGPIAALEDSWSLTYGHVAETIGIMAASASLVMVPLLVLNALATTGDNAFTGIILLISVLTAMVATVVIIASYAERFMQLRKIQEGSLQASPTHPFNYLAILVLAILLVISGMASYSNQPVTPVQKCPIYGLQGLQTNNCLPIQPVQPDPYSAQ